MMEWWAEIIAKIPEVGIAFVVIWFALKMVESERQAMDALVEEWRCYLMNNDEKNREFISELREQQNLAISRLAEEIKSIGSAVSELSGIIRSPGQQQTIDMLSRQVHQLAVLINRIIERNEDVDGRR